jgi:hypothetical protein
MAVGCDASFALGPILAVVGGLIGGSVRLQIGPRWFASAGILQASVGWPGDGKGRAQAYVVDPAIEIDRERSQELEQQENAAEIVAAAKKTSSAEAAKQRERAERRRKAGDFDIKLVGSRQVLVQDGTLSDWLRLAARDTHARGIAAVSHDLARQGLGVPGYGNGIASGFGQASDRQLLMRVWDEAPMDSGRGADPRYEWMRKTVRPTISVTGTITPAMLQSMWNDKRDDGFWERWLFVSPDRLPKRDPRDQVDVSTQTLRDLSEILDALWTRALRVAEAFNEGPELLHYDEAGRAVFDEGHRRHIEQMNHAEFPHRLRGSWTRLETYAGRFWLILTVLHHVAGGQWVDGGDDKWQMANDRGQMAGMQAAPVASSETARGAWRLVEYFKAHTRRVLSARPSPSERCKLPPRTAAGIVMRWMRNHPDRKVVRFQELTRCYSQAHGYDRQMLLAEVNELVQRGMLREVEAEDPKGERRVGRPRSREWMVAERLRAEG